MMAGATPSASAAAVRLPRATTETKDSSCLSLAMDADYGAGAASLLARAQAW